MNVALRSRTRICYYVAALCLFSAARSNAADQFQLRFAEPDPKGPVLLQRTGDHYRYSSAPLATQDDIDTVTTHELGQGYCDIVIRFSRTAADRLTAMTTGKTGLIVGMVVDGQLFAAPHLGGPLGEDVEITSGFSCEQATALKTHLLSSPNSKKPKDHTQ